MASQPRITPKSQPPQLKAAAQRAERQGEAPRAMELLEAVLRQVPDDWPSVQRLADLRARAGDKRGAVELYRRLGEHYEEDDHLPRAIAVWRIVLRHDPGFLGAYVKLGELYHRQGFRAESRRHYEAAVAGFEGRGRRHEAALARQALESTRGGAPETTTPVSPRDPAAPGNDGTDDGLEALSPDEEELVAERLVEAKMYRRYNLLEQARAALDTVLGRVPDHAEARAELAELERDEEERKQTDSGPPDGELPVRPAVASEPGPGPAEPAEDPDLESLEFTLGSDPTATPDEELVVLAGLFDDAVAGPERPDPPAPETPGAVSIGPAVDQGHVDAQLAPEDYRARYDLAVAYREMGLLDEAIAELQLAARGPGHLVECVSAMAVCFLEKGLPSLAVSWLERGLGSAACRQEERHALQYELGAVLEAAGETDRAFEVFTALYGEAAGHRDVAARIGRLRGRPGEAADAEEEE